MIGRRRGTGHLVVGGASLQGASGGRGAVGVGLWSWMFLGGASPLNNAVLSVGKVGLVCFPVLLSSPLRPAHSVMAQQPPDVEEDDCLSEYHHLFCPDLLQ